MIIVPNIKKKNSLLMSGKICKNLKRHSMIPSFFDTYPSHEYLQVKLVRDNFSMHHKLSFHTGHDFEILVPSLGMLLFNMCGNNCYFS